MASATATQVRRMEPQELKTRLQSGEEITLLDVRSDQAWNGSDSKIHGAIRLDPNHWRPDPSWPHDRLTVTYCT